MATPLSAERIVAHAAEIADREGIDAVTLSRVARDLHVRQPAIYRHVDGIHELWKALALRARALLVQDLADAASGRSGEQALRAVAIAWRTFVRVHPGLYAVTDRLPSVGDPDLERSLANVVEVLAQAMDGLSLGPSERVHAARSVRSAFHGFALLERDLGHPAGDEDLDRSYRRLVDLLVAGIRSMRETGAAKLGSEAAEL